jgi:undecaprenyl diphosphate synthase
MEKLDMERLPKHVAIIMDGNGRWAKEQGQDRLFGHYQGVVSVRKVVEAATELGIEYLTLYAFSTENWDRPEQEVTGLMTLFVDTLSKEVPDLHKNKIKLHFIGNLDMLPKEAKMALDEASALTAQNTGLTLIIALSYSSRWELVEATKKIAKKVQNGQLSIEEINDGTISENLTTSEFPDPALMIRTSGECRISNFLLYQLAYAELYFTDTRWPEFRKDDLIKALLDYQSRERRFGKTSEQVQIN